MRPGQRGVLAVRIVVATLGASQFVTSGDHRDTGGEQQARHHVLDLAVTEVVDAGVGGFTLDATVPGAVVVRAVPVALTVVLVVLHVVRDQVTHGEAVVGGDEVHRRGGAPSVVVEDVGGARHPGGEGLDAADGAAPEVAEEVAELVIPLTPSRSPVADLVAEGADVPGLGDHLDAVEGRVGRDDLLELVHLVDVVVAVAHQGGGEVEAEAVDAHLAYPVTHRVDDHVEHPGVGGVDRVAAAGHVVVIALVGGQPVVALMVDATEAQCGPLVTALGGVVVDDVDDDLDARAVQLGDHLLELAHLPTERRLRGVGGVRGEEAKRRVAPVVRQAAPDDEGLGDEVVHGQQFDGVDAGLDEVVDHRVVGQSAVGAAQVLGNRGMQLGEALDVGFEDDALVQGTAPIDGFGRGGVGHHDRQRDGLEGVTRVEDVVRLGCVVKDRAGVVDAARDGAGIGVDQELGGVEAHTGVGVPVAVHAEAIALPGLDPGDVDDPHAIRVHRHVEVVLAAVGCHQGQFDAGGSRRPQGEAATVFHQLGSEDGRVHRLTSLRTHERSSLCYRVPAGQASLRVVLPEATGHGCSLCQLPQPIYGSRTGPRRELVESSTSKGV